MDNDSPQPRSDGEEARVRRGATYRIAVALDSVDFGNLDLDDPVPLGRQILEARGLRPPEAFSLFNILSDGEFEDVRPDEEVDLRARGAERFIAFATDRTFRATLNGRVIAWGETAIPERALRILSGASGNEAIFLEVRGGTDQLIPEGGSADLGGSGTESFITAPNPKVFEFFVNGVRYETNQRLMTGLQIKARVTNWDATHDLVLEGHGSDPDRVIADDESVDLDAGPGPLRFSSVPKANFG